MTDFTGDQLYKLPSSFILSSIDFIFDSASLFFFLSRSRTAGRSILNETLIIKLFHYS